MKCPVCDVELEPVGDLLQCPNDHCSYMGNKGLWEQCIDFGNSLSKTIEEYDDVVEKLKLVVDMLEKADLFFNGDLNWSCRYMHDQIQTTLKEINKKG